MPLLSPQPHSSVCEWHRAKVGGIQSQDTSNLDIQPQTTEDGSLASGIHLPPFRASGTPWLLVLNRFFLSLSVRELQLNKYLLTIHYEPSIDMEPMNNKKEMCGMMGGLHMRSYSRARWDRKEVRRYSVEWEGKVVADKWQPIHKYFVSLFMGLTLF